MEKDYLNDGQKLLPKIEMDKLKKTQRSQKYSSYRLAQPRIYPDPYEGVFYRPKTPSMIRTESQNKSFNYY